MNNMDTRTQDLNDIADKVMRAYHGAIDDYLQSKKQGSLTDADVTMMVMNALITISTNIYYSLKQILPTSPLDFDFLRAKAINELVSSFMNIKDFKPESNRLPLTPEQCREILDKGFCMVKLADGVIKRVEKKDLHIKKSELEKIASEINKESIDATNSPKIVDKSGRPLQR